MRSVEDLSVSAVFMEKCADCIRRFIFFRSYVDLGHSLCATCETGFVCRECVSTHVCFRGDAVVRRVEERDSIKAVLSEVVRVGGFVVRRIVLIRTQKKPEAREEPSGLRVHVWLSAFTGVDGQAAVHSL